MSSGTNKDRLDSALSTGPVVTCMKTLMMVFNFIFWVTGVVILAIGIWTKVDMYQYLELSSIYQPEAPYILIGVGAVIVLVGSIGCCCTLKGHSLLLYVFSGFLFIVFIVELSAGITLMIYRGKLVCCGINNYTDWYKTPFSKSEGEAAVPLSCCSVDAKRCQTTGLNPHSAAKNIHTQGCHKLVVDFINGNMGPIGGVALGISFFQVLGSLLAFCLAKSITKSKYEQI
ncbi:hypothetical protein EGW08_012097 [Elysia chlorotica]|uniref:Tetraspanin n=1 Tax=Elysia chlorotica TaxID=188477 RepID=A0A3S1BG99_ELYCH|nr:hypothetical protein EGW08_012097 [Elysia chlorotica]